MKRSFIFGYYKPINQFYSMAQTSIDLPTMFSYYSKTNIPWNLSSYSPIHQYLDPQFIKQDRQSKLNKYNRTSSQPPNEIHEKTFFLDQQIRPYIKNPSPNKYKIQSIFNQARNHQKSKSIKVNPRLIKHTYLDEIQIQHKTRKKPSVGNYDLIKTDRQIKQQIKALSKKKGFTDPKRHFYDANQTNEVPGAGLYNPHFQINAPSQPSRKTFKWWIQYHKTQSKKDRKKQAKTLAPNSYRPMSASFNSFDKMQTNSQKNKNKSKVKKQHSKLGFASTDARFNYMREKKIKIQEKRPNSATYSLLIDWDAKKSQNLRRKGWFRCLSAGPSRRVYH